MDNQGSQGTTSDQVTQHQAQTEQHAGKKDTSMSKEQFHQKKLAEEQAKFELLSEMNFRKNQEKLKKAQTAKAAHFNEEGRKNRESVIKSGLRVDKSKRSSRNNDTVKVIKSVDRNLQSIIAAVQAASSSNPNANSHSNQQAHTKGNANSDAQMDSESETEQKLKNASRIQEAILKMAANTVRNQDQYSNKRVHLEVGNHADRSAGSKQRGKSRLSRGGNHKNNSRNSNRNHRRISDRNVQRNSRNAGRNEMRGTASHRNGMQQQKAHVSHGHQLQQRSKTSIGNSWKGRRSIGRALSRDGEPHGKLQQHSRQRSLSQSNIHAKAAHEIQQHNEQGVWSNQEQSSRNEQQMIQEQRVAHFKSLLHVALQDSFLAPTDQLFDVVAEPGVPVDRLVSMVLALPKRGVQRRKKMRSNNKNRNRNNYNSNNDSNSVNEMDNRNSRRSILLSQKEQIKDLRNLPVGKDNIGVLLETNLFGLNHDADVDYNKSSAPRAAFIQNQNRAFDRFPRERIHSGYRRKNSRSLRRHDVFQRGRRVRQQRNGALVQNNSSRQSGMVHHKVTQQMRSRVAMKAAVSAINVLEQVLVHFAKSRVGYSSTGFIQEEPNLMEIPLRLNSKNMRRGYNGFLDVGEMTRMLTVPENGNHGNSLANGYREVLNQAIDIIDSRDATKAEQITALCSIAALEAALKGGSLKMLGDMLLQVQMAYVSASSNAKYTQNSSTHQSSQGYPYAVILLEKYSNYLTPVQKQQLEQLKGDLPKAAISQHPQFKQFLELYESMVMKDGASNASTNADKLFLSSISSMHNLSNTPSVISTRTALLALCRIVGMSLLDDPSTDEQDLHMIKATMNIFNHATTNSNDVMPEEAFDYGVATLFHIKAKHNLARRATKTQYAALDSRCDTAFMKMNRELINAGIKVYGSDKFVSFNEQSSDTVAREIAEEVARTVRKQFANRGLPVATIF